MQRKALTAALAVALLGTAAAAYAATKTATFQVTATVANNCFIDSASTLAFGTYDPSSATALDQTSTITVRCTNKANYTLFLNAGTTAGGTFANRLMASGTDTLQYNLYTTAQRNTVWGDGTNSTSGVTGIGQGLGAGQTNSHTVFGRIPVQPNAVSGNYADTVTVTISY